MSAWKGFLVFRKPQPSVEVCHFFRFQNFLPKNACKLFRPKPELCHPKFNIIMLNNILTCHKFIACFESW